MAAIFNEWAKRYAKNPDGFTGIVDENGIPPEDYGENCAIYFDLLVKEMDAANKLPRPY